ncbi:MAG: helix-turn-helix transcriptional regulator [Betaproteobacteria bacterium]|nr:helix-turn-helix transcriptional regulator [Betaproteobacteria bacterium]
MPFRNPDSAPAARILAAADQLFYSQGIRAVGVDAIAAEAKVSKRTLYNHYASKDALIAAYLTARFRHLPPSDRPAREQILGAFERLERVIASPGFRGCPYVNSVTELGDPRHPAHAIALQFKEQRRLWFKALLERLEVKDADALASQLQILAEGALITALVRGDPAVARSARAAAETLLDAAGARVSWRGSPPAPGADRRGTPPGSRSSGSARGPS